jgi:hypothetical protein
MSILIYQNGDDTSITNVNQKQLQIGASNTAVTVSTKNFTIAANASSQFSVRMNTTGSSNSATTIYTYGAIFSRGIIP